MPCCNWQKKPLRWQHCFPAGVSFWQKRQRWKPGLWQFVCLRAGVTTAYGVRDVWEALGGSAPPSWRRGGCGADLPRISKIEQGRETFPFVEVKGSNNKQNYWKIPDFSLKMNPNKTAHFFEFEFEWFSTFFYVEKTKTFKKKSVKCKKNEGEFCFCFLERSVGIKPFVILGTCQGGRSGDQHPLPKSRGGGGGPDSPQPLNPPGRHYFFKGHKKTFKYLKYWPWPSQTILHNTTLSTTPPLCRRCVSTLFLSQEFLMWRQN